MRTTFAAHRRKRFTTELAALLAKYDVNAAAASVKVYAVKPASEVVLRAGVLRSVQSGKPCLTFFFCAPGTPAAARWPRDGCGILAADASAAFSAGLKPGVVHPLAIEAMREVGVDISAAIFQRRIHAAWTALRLCHHGLRPRAGQLPDLSGAFDAGALAD